ncbi:MAG TPA: energy transducer TonB [Sphingomicrobium sp.]|jgi:protein TonB
MAGSSDRRPPTRVVDEPKRSIVPFLAIAIVAAIVIWTVEQDRIQDLTSRPGKRRELPAASHQVPLPTNRSSGDLRTLFTADDYPAEAQLNGYEGTVQVALTIDVSGRVSGCTIVRSSNHESLDQATCDILQRRARFVPARDAAGRPVPDRVISPPVTWRLEG